MTKLLSGASLCFCLLLSIGVRAENFSDVFVFGDSLSDTGNLAAFVDINLPSPPFPGPQPIGTVGLCNPVDIFVLGRRCDDLFFMESRVSNGPVAVEILAKRLGFDELKPSLYFLPLGARPFVGTNYAVAGATARMPDLGHLQSQVSGFLADNLFLAPPGALYIVMIGGNDVIDAVKALPTSYEASRDIIAGAVGEIGDQINLLIARGARKFLVANSVNVGRVPAARATAEAAGIPPAILTLIATHLTREFNHQLAARLEQIQENSLVEIREFDLFRSFEWIRLTAKVLQLNTVDACFDSETYRDFSMLMAERRFHPDCAPEAPDGPKFERFLFFDDLHPTGQVHAALGNALFRSARRLID